MPRLSKAIAFGGIFYLPVSIESIQLLNIVWFTVKTITPSCCGHPDALLPEAQGYSVLG